jgi:hypothetical protein
MRPYDGSAPGLVARFYGHSNGITGDMCVRITMPFVDAGRAGRKRFRHQETFMEAILEEQYPLI